MLTRTITQELYTFAELDETAQYRAVSDFLQYTDELGFIVDEYESDHLHDLRGVHYNAAGKLCNNLEHEYNISFTQGDGFNFYGRLNLLDIIDFMGEDIPADKRGKLDGETVTFEPNRFYTYSKWDLPEYEDALTWALIEADEDIDEHAARDLASGFCAKMDDHCCTLYGLLSDFVLEGAYNPMYYDGQLFDESGAFACYAEEVA